MKKILITPDKAKELLNLNVHNRRANERTIKRYAEAMKSGRWKENTFEFIKIHADGTIADGQHRLHAVVKSGVPIVFDVVYNVPKDVFTVLDTGRNRNGADTFKVAGIKYDSVLPSIIQTFISIQSGYTDLWHTKMSNIEVLKEYNNSPDFWDHVAHKSIGWYADFAKILVPSFIGGLYAHFCLVSHLDAGKFMHQLCTGADISNKSILIVRNRLIQDKTALRKIMRSHKIAYIIKAWNAFRTNQEIKIIKFAPEKESFPKAI